MDLLEAFTSAAFLALIVTVVVSGNRAGLDRLRALAARLDERGAGAGGRCLACGHSRAGIDAAAPCPECGLTTEDAGQEVRRRPRWHPALLIPLLAGPAWLAIMLAWAGPGPLTIVLPLLACVSLPFLILAWCFRRSGLLRHRRVGPWMLAVCTAVLALLTAALYGVAAPSWHDTVVPTALALFLTVVCGWVTTALAACVRGALGGAARPKG